MARYQQTEAPHHCNGRGLTLMEVTQSMQVERNHTHAAERPVDGLIRTRYTLDVCIVCGGERVHTPRHQTSCPECGASAHRSFALFRGLTEVKR